MVHGGELIHIMFTKGSCIDGYSDRTLLQVDQ